jgi:DNA-binding NarL/FixJ family response regulator
MSALNYPANITLLPSVDEDFMNTVAVGVYDTDPITAQGAAARLASYPGIQVIDSDDWRHCQVLLVLASELTEQILSTMSRIRRETESGELNVVLVANTIAEHQVMPAVRAGVVSLLFRQRTDFDQIAAAIMAARSGRAQLPGAVLRYVIDQVRTVQRGSVGSPTDLDGLASREIEVLKLFADGMDTGEVASRLNYSERTVKYITHGIMTRLNLRNRTHAVAFAMRVGVL